MPVLHDAHVPLVRRRDSCYGTDLPEWGNVLAVSAEDLEAFTDAQWELLADCAGVRPPSEVTRALVISSVRVRRADREKVSDDDLFVGLGR